MPAALAGDGDDLGYAFTIQAGAQQIVDFYRSEMPGLGWEYSVAGSNVSSGSLMIFLKEGVTLTISYFPHGDEMLVLIVK